MSIDRKYNLEDYERMAQRTFDRFFGSGNGLFMVVLLVLGVLGVFSLFYTVQPEEEAVVTRFGRYLDTMGPGLHVKLPYGIDRVQKIRTLTVFEETFGFISKANEDQNSFREPLGSKKLDQESLMLTGDLNVADVAWVVQYQVSHPKQFLFNTAEPIQNIRDIVQATMRRVVGDRRVDDVIRGTDIESEAQKITQQILDSYNTGVKVVGVKIKRAYPPEAVKDSFNEVNAAKQEQEQAINEAEAHYNEIIPKARGEAEQQISEARGKAVALVNNSQGDVARFSKLAAEYIKAPEVTRTRLYLEAMEKLLARLNSVTVVDPKIDGLLPIYGGLGTDSAGRKGQLRSGSKSEITLPTESSNAK